MDNPFKNGALLNAPFNPKTVKFHRFISFFQSKIMAFLNPVIVPAKALKDGRHKIRIAISHNSEFRYLVTDIIIDSAKEFKNGQIVKRPDAAMLNTKLRGIIQKYQAAIDELDYIEGLTCPELVYQIKNIGSNRHRTLTSIYEELKQYSKARKSSIMVYDTIMNSIRECIGDKILVENVTHTTMLSIENYMREKRGCAEATIRNRLSFVKTLINYAKRCGYSVPRVDPTLGFPMPKAAIRQAWLSVDEVRKIRDFAPKVRTQILARDLFMLSYYLGGINMADLVDIDFNACGNHIKYIRRKTFGRDKSNRYVEFDIPSEAIAIIERIKGPDGRIALTKFQHDNCCKSMFKRTFPAIAAQLGFNRLIFYCARKSFAQHAFNLGVEIPVIEYILGHSLGKSGTCLFNYIAITPEKATEAIKKVLDNLRNSI